MIQIMGKKVREVTSSLAKHGQARSGANAKVRNNNLSKEVLDFAMIDMGGDRVL